jgi:(p)ppGpp synthase/HD superfamily hydrolase
VGLTVDLQQAAELAITAHGDQTDKLGVPYREHLRAVAGGLEPFGARLQMAGWLHDVLEDTAMTADGLRAAGVPADVVAIVERLTRVPDQDYLEMIRHVTGSEEATLVKIADNAHNSRPDRQAALSDQRLAARYRAARAILWPAASAASIEAILIRLNPALLPELEAMP